MKSIMTSLLDVAGANLPGNSLRQNAPGLVMRLRVLHLLAWPARFSVVQVQQYMDSSDDCGPHAIATTILVTFIDDMGQPDYRPLDSH